MNKYIKISIAIGVILFIAIATFMDYYFGYDSTVHEKSLNAFNIVDEAYKEDRELTDYEIMELKEFEEYANKWVENADKKEKLSERDSNSAGLILTVNSLVMMYPMISDKEFADEDSLDLFHENYKNAQLLLD
ncbi:hypothetical protein MKX29_01155 [Cytobacillus sp. FSL R7-0696]|uniref:hypothetical protein n=1 Tax=Cytobacillus sp. FSL R7-0696 TaxID=2921691 RepID=UPI0030F80701